MISELNKAASVKPEHCVVFGSEDYAAIPEGKRSSYYVLPESKDIIEYLPEQTGKRGAKPINKQVTFYLMEDQLETLKKIVRIQDIRKSMDHGQIVTYRFAVLGLLLNNEALDRKPTGYTLRGRKEHERSRRYCACGFFILYIIQQY